MMLQGGKYYRSKCGEIWCCVRLRPWAPIQAQADCVRLEDMRDEYFYADGRYDEAGEREHCLVEEVIHDGVVR